MTFCSFPEFEIFAGKLQKLEKNNLWAVYFQQFTTIYKFIYIFNSMSVWLYLNVTTTDYILYLSIKLINLFSN